MSYLKLSQEQINRAKRLADEISGVELLAIVALHGIANTRGYCIDVVECGDCTPDEVPNTEIDYIENGAEMMQDIINKFDLREVAVVNGLANGSVVQFEQRYVAVKK
jgi:hypothetical protein